MAQRCFLKRFHVQRERSDNGKKITAYNITGPDLICLLQTRIEDIDDSDDLARHAEQVLGLPTGSIMPDAVYDEYELPAQTEFFGNEKTQYSIKEKYAATSDKKHGFTGYEPLFLSDSTKIRKGDIIEFFTRPYNANVAYKITMTTHALYGKDMVSGTERCLTNDIEACYGYKVYRKAKGKKKEKKSC